MSYDHILPSSSIIENPSYQHIIVPRTAHYIVTGPPAEESITTTIACHGYGQLATYMSRKFQLLADRGHRIISVEGLNKFYWEGTAGRPVATWMTSHHRQDEITDFCHLLSAIYDKECRGARRVVVAGFSQGGTTLWRWLHRHRPTVQAFINIAGWIPEDIDLSAISEMYADAEFCHLYSETDQYYTEERAKQLKAIATTTGIPIEYIPFEGGHRVVPESLLGVYRKWE